MRDRLTEAGIVAIGISLCWLSYHSVLNVFWWMTNGGLYMP